MNRKKNLIKKTIFLGVWVIVLAIIPMAIDKYNSEMIMDNTSYLSSDYQISDYDVTLNVDRNNRVDVIEQMNLNITDDDYHGILRNLILLVVKIQFKLIML